MIGYKEINMQKILGLIGLIIGLIVFIPKIIFNKILNYFEKKLRNPKNLTANPKIHLERAKSMLEREDNSLLLYVAVEIRFALERMLQQQLKFTENVSLRMLDEYDPVKKKKNISRLEPNSEFAFKIFIVNKETNERTLWDEYIPFDLKEIKKIQGKLGDILHPKDSLKLGISDDPWYIETKRFLQYSHDYLYEKLDKHTAFFLNRGNNIFEFQKIEKKSL